MTADRTFSGTFSKPALASKSSRPASNLPPSCCKAVLLKVANYTHTRYALELNPTGKASRYNHTIQEHSHVWLNGKNKQFPSGASGVPRY